jgi:hypothetical protein
LAGALALACMGSAPDARADEHAQPILLTNEDIDRIRSQPTSAEDAGKGLILTSDPAAASVASPPPALPAARAEARPATPALGTGPEAGSWQEEYYRLKAMALRQAMERGESIDFSDGMMLRRSAAGDDAAAALALPAAAPSCMYGPNGSLLYQPEGIRCGATRNEATHRQSSGKHDSCLYDHGGNVIHAPAGRRCDRR